MVLIVLSALHTQIYSIFLNNLKNRHILVNSTQRLFEHMQPEMEDLGVEKTVPIKYSKCPKKGFEAADRCLEGRREGSSEAGLKMGIAEV